MSVLYTLDAFMAQSFFRIQKNNMNPLVFTLKKKEIPVLIDEKSYRLVELDGAARDEVMADSFKRMTFNDKGRPTGFKEVRGIQTALISQCLVDEKGAHVPKEMIGRWRATVVEALYKACQELNGIQIEGEIEKEKEVAKNDDSTPNAGTGSP